MCMRSKSGHWWNMDPIPSSHTSNRNGTFNSQFFSPSSVSWETTWKSNVWARVSQSTSGGDWRHQPVRLGVDGNCDGYSSWGARKTEAVFHRPPKSSFVSLWAHGLALYLFFRLAVLISPLSRDALGYGDFIGRKVGGLLGRWACRGKTQVQIIKHCSHVHYTVSALQGCRYTVSMTCVMCEESSYRQQSEFP